MTPAKPLTKEEIREWVDKVNALYRKDENVQGRFERCDLMEILIETYFPQWVLDELKWDY